MVSKKIFLQLLHWLVVMVSLLILGWGLPACGKRSGSMSEENRTELQVLAAQSEFLTESKYHKVATIMCKLCEESIGKSDSSASFHLQSFEYANREALKHLRREIGDWQRTLSEEERLRFIIKVSSESYSGRLLNCDRAMRQRPAIEPLYHDIMGVIEIRR